MRKIIVSMWVTLDGFVAGPNDEMDWIMHIYDEAMGQYETDLVNSADTLLLGRKTYESFAGAWPKVPENPQASAGEVAYAQRINAIRKLVISNTLETVEWNNAQLVKEDLGQAITKLKLEAGGDVIIYGSVSVVQALTKLGLIDEYQLLVYPVILGGGKALFQTSAARVNLKLVKSQIHPSGVAVLSYRLAGKVE